MNKIGLLVAPIIVALASSASSQDLRLASGWPDTHSAHGAIEAFVEHVEGNSDLKIQVFHSGSLLSFGEIPGGLRDGVVNIGSILPPYYPSDFPETALVANLSMLTNVGTRTESAGAVMAGVTMDYLFNCEECLDSYKEQNEVYLGSLSSATYELLCKDPILTIDDIKGKKFRVGQANFGRFVEKFGGVQVALPANEMYEAMSQGVVDCAVLSISDLTGYQMADIVKHVMLDIPGGVFSGVDTFNMNRETWQGLTDDQRKTILEASALGNAEGTTRLFNQAKSVKESAESLGVTVYPATEALLAPTAEFIHGDVAMVSAQFAEEFKVKNADAKIEEITALIEKWKGLINGWDGESASLAKIYDEHILSKVDPSTYGMN